MLEVPAKRRSVFGFLYKGKQKSQSESDLPKITAEMLKSKLLGFISDYPKRSEQFVFQRPNLEATKIFLEKYLPVCPPVQKKS